MWLRPGCSREPRAARRGVEGVEARQVGIDRGVRKGARHRRREFKRPRREVDGLHAAKSLGVLRLPAQAAIALVPHGRLALRVGRREHERGPARDDVACHAQSGERRQMLKHVAYLYKVRSDGGAIAADSAASAASDQVLAVTALQSQAWQLARGRVPQRKALVAVVRQSLLVERNHLWHDVEANVRAEHPVRLPRRELPVDVAARDVDERAHVVRGDDGGEECERRGARHAHVGPVAGRRATVQQIGVVVARTVPSLRLAIEPRAVAVDAGEDGGARLAAARRLHHRRGEIGGFVNGSARQRHMQRRQRRHGPRLSLFIRNLTHDRDGRDSVHD